MKKLMILAAVAVMAIGAQAATAAWTFNNGYMPGGTATTDKLNGCMTYLVFSSASTDVAAAYGTLAKADVDAAVKDGSLATKAAASAATSSAGGMTTTISDFGSFKAGDSATAYIVILDAPTLAQAKNYLVVDPTTATISWESDVGQQTFAAGNIKALTQDAGNWSSAAAPEPTSGLLLLLGIAGIALKRKRA